MSMHFHAKYGGYYLICRSYTYNIYTYIHALRKCSCIIMAHASVYVCMEGTKSFNKYETLFFFRIL